MAETAKPQDTKASGPTKAPGSTKTAGPKKAGLRPDLDTLAGIALALAGIVGGLILEKGSIQDIAQATAFFGAGLGDYLAASAANVSGSRRRFSPRMRSCWVKALRRRAASSSCFK